MKDNRFDDPNLIFFPVRGIRTMATYSGVPEFQSSRVARFQGSKDFRFPINEDFRFPISHFLLIRISDL